MNKIFYILSWITILLALGLMGLFFYWKFYPYKTIDFGTEPHYVAVKEVKAGSHVSFVLDYCKYRNTGAELSVSFVDGFIYNTTPVAVNMPVGCHTFNQSVYVPKAIPAGTYSVSMLFRYNINLVRTIDVITMSEKFVVVK